MASEPRGRHLFGISLGGVLSTAQTVSGMEVARAWFRLWHGTWEPVAQKRRPFTWILATRSQEGVRQAAETARCRVPLLGTGADRLVLAMKLGNASGAKGTDRPDLLINQPFLNGMK
jgi:hypothetical protein